MDSPLRGHREAAAFWRRLLTFVPDLRGEVISWGFRGQHVYVELRMFGTLGGKPIEWVVLDRIVLEDGRVRQRSPTSTRCRWCSPYSPDRGPGSRTWPRNVSGWAGKGEHHQDDASDEALAVSQNHPVPTKAAARLNIAYADGAERASALPASSPPTR